MEIMRMDALLDSECISMQMSNTTKEILAKIKWTEKEYITSIMVINIKANTLKG